MISGVSVHLRILSDSITIYVSLLGLIADVSSDAPVAQDEQIPKNHVNF